MALYKPDKLTYNQNVLQHKGRYYAVISAALGFSLRDPAKFLSEPDLLAIWNSAAKQMPMDEAYIKPKAEVMLIGTAPAPPRQGHYQITLQMNEIHKSILVFAPRKWSQAPLGQFVIEWNTVAPKPLSFSWQNAYGGEGFTVNPAGTGFLATTPLPAFEVISPGIHFHADPNIIPAGFSPMDMLDVRRRQYFHDDKEYWQQQGLPIFPDNFDFRFFQQALPDQQRTTPFQKAEPYHLQLGKQIFSGALPDIHIRLFLANKKFERGFANPFEFPLTTDTLYFLPHEKTGILIARTCFEVNNIHMNEWEHVLLLLEQPDQPHSFDECTAIFADYLHKAAVLKPSDHQLTPNHKASKLLQQKAGAEQAFDNMQQWVGKIKPSSFPDKTIRIKGNELILRKAKNFNFSGYDFSHFEILNKNFNGISFQDCTFRVIYFTENTFNHCIFINCQFENTCFYQVKLQGCEFIHCRLTHSDFRASELNDCRITTSHLNAIEFDRFKIAHSYWIDNFFINSAARNSLWHNTQIKGGHWKNLDLHQAEFNTLRVQDLQMTDCSLVHTSGHNVMMNGRKMAFIRVDFSKAVWSAPNFIESYWYRTLLVDAEIKNAQWSKAKIIRSCLSNSVFAESSFADTLFLSTTLKTSYFKNALFAGAVFKYCAIKNDNQFDHVDFKFTLFEKCL